MKIRRGHAREVQATCERMCSASEAKRSGTIQFDWFPTSDNTECEIRETYENSEAFLAHLSNLADLLQILYEKFASDHSVAIYGDPSPELLETITARGVDTKFFSLLQGLWLLVI